MLMSNCTKQSQVPWQHCQQGTMDPYQSIWVHGNPHLIHRGYPWLCCPWGNPGGSWQSQEPRWRTWDILRVANGAIAFCRGDGPSNAIDGQSATKWRDTQRQVPPRGNAIKLGNFQENSSIGRIHQFLSFFCRIFEVSIFENGCRQPLVLRWPQLTLVRTTALPKHSRIARIVPIRIWFLSFGNFSTYSPVIPEHFFDFYFSESTSKLFSSSTYSLVLLIF